MSAHEKIAAAHTVHAVDRTQQCRLARTALPQQRHGGAGSHLHRHVQEQRASLWQPITYVAELDGCRRRAHVSSLQKTKAGMPRPQACKILSGDDYSSPSSLPSVSSPSASAGTGALIALSGVGAGWPLTRTTVIFENPS